MTTTAIKERPILFSAPMVKALLEGRKTQTRRLVKPQPYECDGEHITDFEDSNGDPISASDGRYLATCPYGKPGDRLWVRETHALLYPTSDAPVIAYRADDSARLVFEPRKGEKFTVEGDAGAAASTWRGETIKWKPSIHMPRWASRITLEIVNVRVERVRDISEADARAEGVTLKGITRHEHECRAAFLDLFFNINKRAPRGANPWVWAITFKRVS